MSNEESREGLLLIVKEFLGPSAKELGEAAGDHIRYYRWKSAVSIIRKAHKWAEERGIDRKNIPLKFIVPFIERCSLEDENTEMADRWSELLVKAADHYSQDYEIYLRILSNITSEEARVLRNMWLSAREYDVFHFDSYSDLFNHIPNNIDFNEFSNSDQPLETLNLSKPGVFSFVLRGNDIPNTNELVLTGFDLGTKLLHLESMRLVRNRSGVFLARGERCFAFESELTPFGYEFVSACEDNADKDE